jgi:hypothetical protein
MDIKKEFQ